MDAPGDRFANFKTTQGEYASPTPQVNAVGRREGSDPHVTGPYDPRSPSGTDWNQTFTQNNPYSPSGTNWSKTFGRASNALPTRVAAVSSQEFGIIQDPSGELRTGNVPAGSPSYAEAHGAGNPTGSDALDFYRNRLLDGDLSSRDREMYGAGSDFGFLT